MLIRVCNTYTGLFLSSSAAFVDESASEHAEDVFRDVFRDFLQELYTNNCDRYRATAIRAQT